MQVENCKGIKLEVLQCSAYVSLPFNLHVAMVLLDGELMSFCMRQLPNEFLNIKEVAKLNDNIVYTMSI